MMKPISRALLFMVGAIGTVAVGGFLFIGLAFASISDPSLPPAERRQLFLDQLFLNGPFIGVFGYLPLTACLFLCAKAVANPPNLFRGSNSHLFVAAVLAAAVVLLLLVPFLVRFG